MSTYLGYSYQRLGEALKQTKHPEQQLDAWRALVDRGEDDELGRVFVTQMYECPPWVSIRSSPNQHRFRDFSAGGSMGHQEREIFQNLRQSHGRFTLRTQVNLFYLSDEGQRSLLRALRAGQYILKAPEETALVVFAYLIDMERDDSALEVLLEVGPYLNRLRFFPFLTDERRQWGPLLQLRTVDSLKRYYSNKGCPQQILSMREWHSVWAPLYDDLVELWLSSVQGELPYRDSSGQVSGGHPGEVLGGGFWRKRKRWLGLYQRAAKLHPHNRRHLNKKSNFAQLTGLLAEFKGPTKKLSMRQLARLRSCLANTITKHGLPGSEQRMKLRAEGQKMLARVTHDQIAGVLAKRLEENPYSSALSFEELFKPVSIEGDSLEVPGHLLGKGKECVAAPIASGLDSSRLFGNADSFLRALAIVLGNYHSAELSDDHARDLSIATYSAFLAGRAALLLDLEKQSVFQFSQLPWVRALLSSGERSVAQKPTAEYLLQRFLLRGMISRSSQEKNLFANRVCQLQGGGPRNGGNCWRDLNGHMTESEQYSAFTAMKSLLGDSLYSRYYGIVWDQSILEKYSVDDLYSRLDLRSEWTRDFASCLPLAQASLLGCQPQPEAFVFPYEAERILTGDGLANVCLSLGLTAHLRMQGGTIVEALFSQVRKLLSFVMDNYIDAEGGEQRYYRLIWTKRAAYTFRNALFILSLVSSDQQRALIEGLCRSLSDEAHLSPIGRGLRAIYQGESFDSDGSTTGGGRLFLGDLGENHWALP